MKNKFYVELFLSLFIFINIENKNTINVSTRYTEKRKRF